MRPTDGGRLLGDAWYAVSAFHERVTVLVNTVSYDDETGLRRAGCQTLRACSSSFHAAAAHPAFVDYGVRLEECLFS